MTKLNERRALTETQKLFGQKAAIKQTKTYTDKKGNVHKKEYRVGFIDNTIFPMFLVHGTSYVSWEEAIKKAAEAKNDYDNLGK